LGPPHEPRSLVLYRALPLVSVNPSDRGSISLGQRSGLHDPRPRSQIWLHRHSPKLAERTDERWYEAELYRLRGEVLLAKGDADGAEPWISRALTKAQVQSAKLWELHAACSLARLQSEQGRRAQAREILAPVYDWFTEGFETIDLKEAKALLNELS
jgi:hypothetical protein